MLRGQNFRGRHERHLIAVLNGDHRACSATMVLPEPTSPCNNRRMGDGCCMSSAISFSTRFCAAVGWKGKIFLMACAHFVSQLEGDPGTLRASVCRFSLQPTSRKNNSSKSAGVCAGVAYDLARSRKASPRREVDVIKGFTAIHQLQPAALYWLAGTPSGNVSSQVFAARRRIVPRNQRDVSF